jgi:hypothetical protein
MYASGWIVKKKGMLKGMPPWAWNFQAFLSEVAAMYRCGRFTLLDSGTE